jgi:hypothetical protein
MSITLKHTIDESLCILRTGKKNQMLVRIVWCWFSLNKNCSVNLFVWIK